MTKAGETLGERAVVAIQVRLEFASPPPVEIDDRLHAGVVKQAKEFVDGRNQPFVMTGQPATEVVVNVNDGERRLNDLGGWDHQLGTRMPIRQPEFVGGHLTITTVAYGSGPRTSR